MNAAASPQKSQMQCDRDGRGQQKKLRYIISHRLKCSGDPQTSLDVLFNKLLSSSASGKSMLRKGISSAQRSLENFQPRFRLYSLHRVAHARGAGLL